MKCQCDWGWGLGLGKERDFGAAMPSLCPRNSCVELAPLKIDWGGGGRIFVSPPNMLVISPSYTAEVF